MNSKILLATLGLVIVVSGCTGLSTYGENTVLMYEDEIEQDRVEDIHSALTETEWEGQKANITKTNETWYTLSVETDIQEPQITVDRQFQIQQNAFQIKSAAFTNQEVLELKAYNTEGEELATFAQ